MDKRLYEQIPDTDVEIVAFMRYVWIQFIVNNLLGVITMRKEPELTKAEAEEIDTYQLPDFTDEERDWMEGSLTVMSTTIAMRAFLREFPHFTEEAAIDNKVFLVKAIERQVWDRFRNNKRDPRYASYQKIQDNIKALEESKEPFPVKYKTYRKYFRLATPMGYLLELQEHAQQPISKKDLTLSEVLKITEGMKEVYESQSVGESDWDEDDEHNDDF